MCEQADKAIAAGLVSNAEATILQIVGNMLGQHAARSEPLMRWMLACFSYDHRVGVHPSLTPGTVMSPAVTGARDVDLCTALDLCAQIMFIVSAVDDYKHVRPVPALIVQRISEELLARSTKRGSINARHPGWRV